MKKDQRFSIPVLVCFISAVAFATCIGWYYLLKKSPDTDLLRAAISQYDRPTIAKATADMKSALEKGANVNVQSSKGVTALIYCAGYGNAEGVKLLLAHRADVTITTWGGGTALEAAKKERNLEIIQLLQQAGAKE